MPGPARLLLLAAAVCALLLSGAARPVPPVPAAAGQEAGDGPLPATLPQDLPDPSVVRAPDGFYLTATSGSWAPVFPVFFSRDLRSWRQVASVLPRAPRWSRGHFWAPEIVQDGGRFLVLYSASRRGGKACIAAATARHPAGPWRDRGPVLCRPGGAIDPNLVRDERGRRFLVYKAMGLGRGIHARRLSGLRPVGRAVELLRPTEGWEGPVTEGPEVVRRGGEWFMFYAGAGCCRIPCTYAEGVARAPSLLGPWRKHPGGPLLSGGRGWRCAGHGSVVDGGADGTVLVHHAYAEGDLEQRRRQVLLSRVRWGEDGWPALTLGLGPALAPTPAGPAADPGFADGFDGRALAPGWEWLFDRRPSARAEAGALRVGCSTAPARPALVARQVAEDAVTVEGALLPPAAPRAGTAEAGSVGIALHAPDGTVRGVEVAGPAARGGDARRPEVVPARARTFATGPGGAQATGAPLALAPGATVRLRATVRDGALEAAVSTDGATWAPLAALPRGAAGAGQAPTRAGASCRGRAAGRFAWMVARRPG